MAEDEESPAAIITAQVYNNESERSEQQQQRKSADEEIKHLALNISCHNRAGLAANVVLMVGYIFALIFQVYEYNGRDRESFAIFVYFLAFALILLSGITELGVDVLSVRTVGHGRYHSDSARWNRVISVLFIIAGVLDIVAFVYWMRRRMDIELQVLQVSAYVILIMAILALYFQIMDLKSASWKEAIIADKIDLIANSVVLAVSVLGVVLRHMERSDDKDFGDATDKIELATVPLWLFTSMLYVTTDVVRLQQGILD